MDICQPELTLTILSYSAEHLFQNFTENDSESIELAEF